MHAADTVTPSRWNSDPDGHRCPACILRHAVFDEISVPLPSDHVRSQVRREIVLSRLKICLPMGNRQVSAVRSSSLPTGICETFVSHPNHSQQVGPPVPTTGGIFVPCMCGCESDGHVPKACPSVT